MNQTIQKINFWRLRNFDRRLLQCCFDESSGESSRPRGESSKLCQLSSKPHLICPKSASAERSNRYASERSMAKDAGWGDLLYIIISKWRAQKKAAAHVAHEELQNSSDGWHCPWVRTCCFSLPHLRQWQKSHNPKEMKFCSFLVMQRWHNYQSWWQYTNVAIIHL